MKKKTILIVTGSRAEFGILSTLIKKLKKDNYFNTLLYVTGSHLSKEYGRTINEIKLDKIKINHQAKINLKDNSNSGIVKSMIEGSHLFNKFIKTNKTDLLLILGDRFEIFSIAWVAMMQGLPIAHIHGGEITQGSLDDIFRHCITKMSNIHFASKKEYVKRIRQLGEDPKFIFNTGSLGIENIKNHKIEKKIDLEKKLNFRFKEKNILVTFHPSKLSLKQKESEIDNLLIVLNNLKDTMLIFTKSNPDTGGKVINEKLNSFVKKNHHTAVLFSSLGKKYFFSTLSYCDAIVGNSSSGIIEAPAINIPTINIGERQKGRITSPSIITCDNDKKKILSSLKKIYSKNFQRKIKKIKNCSEHKNASDKIIKLLKKIDLKNISLKKFHDINY